MEEIARFPGGEKSVEACQAVASLAVMVFSVRTLQFHDAMENR